MSINKKLLCVVNLLIALSVFIILSSSSGLISNAVISFFDKSGKPLSSLAITPFDLLIVSSIPVWTIPIYIKKEPLTFTHVLPVILLSTIIVALTVFLAYYTGNKISTPDSPLAPQYIIQVPFHRFLSFALISGMFMTYIVFAAYTSVRYRK